jgi:hypothetical protein
VSLIRTRVAPALRTLAAVLGICLLFVPASGGSTDRVAPVRIAGPVRPTKVELLWRQRVANLAIGNPIVPKRKVLSVRRRLAIATNTSGGQVVRLVVRRAPEAAPELVIASSHPARYLKHGLPRLLPLLRGDNSLYLAVLDGRGRLALEWALNGDTNPNHGSLYVRPGLERCSPIVAIGWPSRLPPCPKA